MDLLARDQDDRPGGGLVALDYKSLGVRQLGSIYEGLLEFRLRFDDRGGVVVANDRAERKATGSYYTPDFVVKYIVERTLGPIVAEHTERLRPKFRAAAEARRAAAHRREVTGQKAAEDPATRALVDELFSITVLDPAMGSGHFLVEAVDRLTDRLLDFLARFPQNPVQDQIAQTRRAIIDEMERQHVSIDVSRLTEINLTKRHVLKRCIFGVDLNPMAVELAKVSLWLDSFTLGAPLSFLDHHLRYGNSLAGTTVAEVRTAASQRTLFERDQFDELASATALMRHVGELSDTTTAQVSESRTEYRKAAASLWPYKRLLDLYCGQWFDGGPKPVSAGPKGKQKLLKGNRMKTFYASHPIVEFLNSGRARAIAESDDPVAAAARLPTADRPPVESAVAAASRFRFFHWELEFPEVFFRGGRREPGRRLRRRHRQPALDPPGGSQGDEGDDGGDLPGDVRRRGRRLRPLPRPRMPVAAPWRSPPMISTFSPCSTRRSCGGFSRGTSAT